MAIIHLVPFHPIVVQRPLEDWHQMGVDCVGGEIVPVKGRGFFSLLRKVWRNNVHAQGRGFPFPELAGLFAKRAVYTPHSNTLGQSWLTRVARRWMFNRFDRILCQSEFGKEQFLREGIKKRKLTVIPTPVDYSFFSRAAGGTTFRKKHGLGNKPFALAVGARPVKNPGVIAKACEKAGLKLVVVGPRTAEDAEKMWGGKGFEWYLPDEKIQDGGNVVFVGQLSADEYLQALDAATLFINSSDYESFGMAVYEAAAAGKALCLPEHGVFRNFVGAALFHPSRDVDTLAENIARYVADEKLRKINGEKAQEVARAYDYPAAKKVWEKMYTEVFGDGGK